MKNVRAVPAFQKGVKSMPSLIKSHMCTKRQACFPVELEKNRGSSSLVRVRCGNIYTSDDLVIMGRPEVYLSKRDFPSTEAQNNCPPRNVSFMTSSKSVSNLHF